MKEADFRIQTQAIHVLIGNVGAFFITIFVPIILVRLFDQSQYGFYGQLQTIAMACIPILNFGISESLFYFYPTAQTKRDKSGLLSQSFYSNFVVGLVVLILVIVFRDRIFPSNKAIREMIVLLAGYIFFMLISLFFDSIFIVEKKSKMMMVFLISDKFVRSAFLIFAVVLFKTVLAAIWSLFIYSFLRALLMFFYLKIHYQISPFCVRLSSWKSQMRYVIPMGISALIGTAGSYMDKFLIVGLLSTKEFAIYSVGNFRIPLIALIYISVGSVVLPRISEYSVENKKSETFLLWKKMVVKNVAITIPVVSYCLFLASPLITFFFTKDYVDSVAIFRITLLILLIQMLGYGYILRGFAQTKDILYSYLAKTLFSIVAGYLLIRNFKIIGAALIFVMAYLIEGLWQLVRSKKTVKVKWTEFLPWKDFLILSVISASAGFLIYFLKYFEMGDFFWLAISSIIYFPIIFLLLVRFKYFLISDVIPAFVINKIKKFKTVSVAK